VTSSEDPVGPELDEQIRHHPDQRTPVVVAFEKPRSPEELEELDLYASSPGASSIGYGELDGPAIRALARRDDVASISAILVMPARPGRNEPTRHSASDKVAPSLLMQLDIEPGASQVVIVTFSEPPGADAMLDLGLSEAGPTMGTGTLDPAAIHRLAERPDVVRVSWSPPAHLVNLD
jgi:hypothetical protein